MCWVKGVMGDGSELSWCALMGISEAWTWSHPCSGLQQQLAGQCDMRSRQVKCDHCLQSAGMLFGSIVGTPAKTNWTGKAPKRQMRQRNKINVPCTCEEMQPAKSFLSWCDWKELIQQIQSDAVGTARVSTEWEKSHCVREVPWCTYIRDQTSDFILTHETNNANLGSLLMLGSLRHSLKQE